MDKKDERVMFEVNAYFGEATAVAVLVLALSALGMGGYALIHDRFVIGLVPAGLGLALLIGCVMGLVRRHSPTAYVRVTGDRIEWMYAGKEVVFDRSKVVEIHYSDSDASSFTFSLAGGDSVTCLSGLTPGQEHEVYNFFAKDFLGRLLHNGSEMRRTL